MKINEAILLFLDDQKLTEADLAPELKYSPKLIRSVVRGVYRPSPKFLMKFKEYVTSTFGTEILDKYFTEEMFTVKVNGSREAEKKQSKQVSNVKGSNLVKASNEKTVLLEKMTVKLHTSNSQTIEIVSEIIKLFGYKSKVDSINKLMENK